MSAAEFVYTVVLRPAPLKDMANAVLRAIIPREVCRHGARVVLNPADPVVSGALALRVYEPAETDFFRAVCRPGFRVLDVGANIGYYTALALTRIGPYGRVVALEPDPENLEFLTKTVAANSGRTVTIVPKAAADHAGTMTLFTSTKNRGDNRLYANELADGFCRVEVSPVDEILSALDVPYIDLVKIDVQGYEGHVIRGMRETIRRCREMAVLSEFWPCGLAKAGTDPLQFLSLFDELGLSVFELGRRGRLRAIEDATAFIRRYPGRKYTNLVAVKGPVDRWGVVDYAGALDRHPDV